ncbi:MAG TPA: phage holin family protein [Pyrinomonadaceae bacterium]|nr:phage holin family protein [Pyrinomonadaceae bacterium]
MAQQKLAKEERSLGDLFTELAGETGNLVRQEVALAQAELTYKATTAGKNIGSLAFGGAVAYAGALAVTAGIIMLLAQFIPAWLAALVVGLAIAAAAYFMISSALARLGNTDPVPHESIESIKEDAKWLKKEIT